MSKSEGTVMRAEDVAADEMRRRMRLPGPRDPIIPAYPGFTSLRLWRDFDDQPEPPTEVQVARALAAQPVIAWMLRSECEAGAGEVEGVDYAYPITPSMPLDSRWNGGEHGGWEGGIVAGAVEWPDGRVQEETPINGSIRRHDNRADWIRDVVRQIAERRSRKAKPPRLPDEHAELDPDVPF